MAINFNKISQGINLRPQSADPSPAEDGDLYYNNVTNTFRQYTNGVWSDIASGISNIQMSASSGAFSTSLAAAACFVTITGTGGPIHLTVQHDGSLTSGEIGVTAAGGGADFSIQFRRGPDPGSFAAANILSDERIALSGVAIGNEYKVSPGSFSFIDDGYTPNVPLTYYLGALLTPLATVNGSSPVYVTNVKLVAEEK